MYSLMDKWQNNEAIFPKEFINLAKRVGLKSVHKPGATYTGANLETLMRNWGPLWCAGHWYGPGHIIVVTGVLGDIVFLNDPDRGRQKTGKIDWFNKKLDNQLEGAIMVKDPKAY